MLVSLLLMIGTKTLLTATASWASWAIATEFALTMMTLRVSRCGSSSTLWESSSAMDSSDMVVSLSSFFRVVRYRPLHGYRDGTRHFAQYLGTLKFSMNRADLRPGFSERARACTLVTETQFLAPLPPGKSGVDARDRTWQTPPGHAISCSVAFRHAAVDRG